MASSEIKLISKKSKVSAKKTKKTIHAEPPSSPPPPPPEIPEDGQWIYRQKDDLDNFFPKPQEAVSSPSQPAMLMSMPDFCRAAGPSADQVSQEDPKRPWTSPYQEAPATLYFGPNEVAYLVPPHFLPPHWKEPGALHFPDVDSKTGHTIVHYLYKDTYETPVTQKESEGGLGKDYLRAALLVFIATESHNLAALQKLAIDDMQLHSQELSVSEVLAVIDDDFSRLLPDSWVHEHLRSKAGLEFASNHTVFTSNTLLRDLKNTDLVKFMMRCVVDLYDSRLSQMLNSEKAAYEEHEAQKARSVEWVAKPDDIALKHIATIEIPTRDESSADMLCQPEVEESPPSDDFSTISCPVSEAPVLVWPDSDLPGPEPEPYVDDCVRESPPHEPVMEATEAWPEATPPVPELEPEPCAVDYIDEIAETVPCEEAMEEPVAEVELAIPDIPTPPVCEPADEIVEDNMALEPRCPRQSRHVLKGDGWKTCKRCRVVVAQLAREV